MKAIFIILASLLIPIFAWTQTDSLIVQVGAFEHPVSTDYFAGLDSVYLTKDHNAIYHYYIGGFTDMETAEIAKTYASALGFNARIINLEIIKNDCTKLCSEKVPMIRSIFFDFDRYRIKRASRKELDKLYAILIKNPNLQAEMRAHTDFLGSSNYNERLSEKRAKAAKKYLATKGIDIDRLKTSIHGESAPIAKNTLADGSDTEEGRQLNRRVEILVLDANGDVIYEMIEPIDVPDYLVPM